MNASSIQRLLHRVKYRLSRPDLTLLRTLTEKPVTEAALKRGFPYGDPGQHLARLQRRGLISCQNRRWQLTETGRNLLNTAETTAAGRTASLKQVLKILPPMLLLPVVALRPTPDLFLLLLALLQDTATARLAAKAAVKDKKSTLWLLLILRLATAMALTAAAILSWDEPWQPARFPILLNHLLLLSLFLIPAFVMQQYGLYSGKKNRSFREYTTGAAAGWQLLIIFTIQIALLAVFFGFFFLWSLLFAVAALYLLRSSWTLFKLTGGGTAPPAAALSLWYFNRTKVHRFRFLGHWVIGELRDAPRTKKQLLDRFSAAFCKTPVKLLPGINLDLDSDNSIDRELDRMLGQLLYDGRITVQGTRFSIRPK